VRAGEDDLARVCGKSVEEQGQGKNRVRAWGCAGCKWVSPQPAVDGYGSRSEWDTRMQLEWDIRWGKIEAPYILSIGRRRRGLTPDSVVGEFVVDFDIITLPHLRLAESRQAV